MEFSCYYSGVLYGGRLELEKIIAALVKRKWDPATSEAECAMIDRLNGPTLARFAFRETVTTKGSRAVSSD
jgi:hypothetical protein